LDEIMEGSSKGQPELTVGPWFPQGTELSTIVQNFQYGISRLSLTHRLHENSPFVSGALSAFETYFQSGETATFFQRGGLDFLSSAAPGLEREIANAIRLTLTR